jgi:hypothetical protein
MKNLFCLVLLSFCLGSCCKDYSELIPGQDFIPAHVLKAIEDNGQTIHAGYTPPVLEGKFHLTPNVLMSSNFDDLFSPGFVFADYFVEFYDFDPNTLTIRVNTKQLDQNGIGYGGFVSGQGNNFTVYVKVESTDSDGHTVLITEVLSGALEAGGIRNLQHSVFMVDDRGDPQIKYIENGEGRLFADGDQFSEKI